MRICWDNLENIRLSRNGTFRESEHSYIYKESCVVCGEPYLTRKSDPSKFCGHSCASSGKTMSVEARIKMSKNGSKRIGILNSNYKGEKAGLTVYDKYKDRLGLCEEIRRQEGTELLEVKCTYCGKWYAPTYGSVINRFTSLNNLNKGENRLYCSENCKQSCPTFGQIKYPRGFEKATSREVSTYLRQMCFERDNWECQKCGKTINEIQLHCHHINGYAQNKILANDIDNVITLCKECHKKVHKLPGCNYYELRCK